jgi:hypothetical protein
MSQMIILSAHFALIQSKLSVFKKLLNEEQLEIYNQTILETKNKFLEKNADASLETIEEINKIFKL